MLWLVIAAAWARPWERRVGHNQRLPGSDMAPDTVPEGLLHHPYCVLSQLQLEHWLALEMSTLEYTLDMVQRSKIGLGQTGLQFS